MTRTTRRDLVKLGGGATALAALGGRRRRRAHGRRAGAEPARRLSHRARSCATPRNPILRPGTQPWESKFVFNPAAIVKDGLIQLLYRAQGPDGRSSIGLATSSDGVRFRRRKDPVMVATEPYELPGGCEDPRVVLIRGTYYMTYTGYDGTSARLCLATSRTSCTGPSTARCSRTSGRVCVDKPWSKSGAILTTPLDGRYIMYFGDKDIYYAWSTDLIHWTPGPVDEPVMRPQPGTYTEELLEPGPPPLITENGQILLIHNAAAKDPDGKLIYRAGQALIDPAKPTEELARLTTPWLVPETPEEIAGQVNNVVFVEGLVAYKRRWFMYYGQGDAGVGVLHGRSRTGCG